MTVIAKAVRRLGWPKVTILFTDAVLCLLIAAISVMSIVGNLSLRFVPVNGLDGTPLPIIFLVAPAIALLSGSAVSYAAVLALAGHDLRRRLLMISLTVICLLYVVEAVLHIVNVGQGGNLSFAICVAGASIFWWIINFLVARDQVLGMGR